MLERTLIPLQKSGGGGGYGLSQVRAAVGRLLSGETAGGKVGEELAGREPSSRLQCSGMVYEHLIYAGDSGSRNAKVNIRNTLKEMRCQEIKSRKTAE